MVAPQGAGPMQVEIKKEGRRGDRSIYWGLQKDIDARYMDTCSFPAGKGGKKRRKQKGIGQLSGSCERSLVHLYNISLTDKERESWKGQF
jgi:hypothetical protein